MLSASRTVATLLLAGGIAVAAPACASSYYGRGPYYGGYGTYDRGVQQRAYERGFHEGTEAGEKDGRRGRSFDLTRHDDYRDADEGYNRDYGDKEFYRRAFRDGFRAGYEQTYRQYAGGYRPW